MGREWNRLGQDGEETGREWDGLGQTERECEGLGWD